MATTSKMGIPYPASTDFVKDGATDMQAIADQVDKKSGLVKITPTSVSGTGVTIASNGDVNVSSGGNSVTVEGIFTSDFQNYRIIVSDLAFNSDSGMFVKLRNSGGTAATNYYWAGLYVGYTSTTVVGEVSGGAATRFGTAIIASTTSTGGAIEVYQPNLAVPTGIMSVPIDARTGGAARGIYNGFHNAATAYTAIVFEADTAKTFTKAKFQVYGYN